MPNWCNNKLRVSGDRKDIANFVKKHIIKDELVFNTIIPEPKGKKDCPINYIVKDNNTHHDPKQKLSWKDKHFDWYQWRLDNWGCKWDCNTNGIDKHNSYVIIYYDTPWSPALKVVKRIMELYPNLHIENSYYEPGMGFAGVYGTDGLLQLDYQDNYKEYKNFVISEGFDNFDWEEE